MNQPSQTNSASRQGTARPAMEQSARLQAILEELNRPLKSEKWSSDPETRRTVETRGYLERVQRHRQHRRVLRDARAAARKALGVDPQGSVRKQASIMMSAGAVGLAAFTAPQTNKNAAPLATELQDFEETRQSAALLSASDTFKRALIEEEGVRYTVYRDVAGYPTVGIGHLVTSADNLRVGDRIDENRVLEFLERDLEIAAEGVRGLVGDLPLFQHEFDALLDLVYNVGAGNVAPDHSPQIGRAHV